MTKAIMFQGVGSDVGKSLIVAGLCRLFARRGIRVMPFKPQNMSNNAAVAEGGEIGRAQWLQAFAAGLTPSVHMNPVLLKPQSDHTSQVIVQGKFHSTLRARDYHAGRNELMNAVMASYQKLSKDAELILVEGAGSPAETNLRATDIANMGFARQANVPVVLIGDIDRGGVIASLVGTHTVLDDADRSMICGFLINKFRGDANLFDDGIRAIEKHTNWQPLGVIPYHHSLRRLPQEDALALNQPSASGGNTLICALALPHLANFDDLDPLASEPDVTFRWLKAGDDIPMDAKLVIIPGSKATMSDLAFIKVQGWDQQLKSHYARGGYIYGLCGGYQILGNTLHDPYEMEGIPHATGLGFLDIATHFAKEKKVSLYEGTAIAGKYTIKGYEIHLGNTRGDDCLRPLFSENEGATSPDGRVMGSYIHGLFANDEYRRHIMRMIGSTADETYHYWPSIHGILDEWADILEASLDIRQLLTLAQPVSARTQPA